MTARNDFSPDNYTRKSDKKGKEALLGSLTLIVGVHENFPGARGVLEPSPFINFPTPPHSMQNPNMTQTFLQLTKSNIIKQKANLDLMPESLAVESLLLTTASSQLKAPPSTFSSPDTLHPSSSKHHRDQAFGKPSPETRHEMVYFKQVLSKLHSAVKM